MQLGLHRGEIFINKRVNPMFKAPSNAGPRHDQSSMYTFLPRQLERSARNYAPSLMDLKPGQQLVAIFLQVSKHFFYKAWKITIVITYNQHY